MNVLENKIIISTRPISENDLIKSYLTGKGATVIDFPMIEIVPSDLNDKITNTLRNINSFQWIVFTSKNGVKYFFKLINELGINKELLRSNKIAVVGQNTSDEVIKNGFKPFLISSGNTSEDLLKQIQEIGTDKNENILLALGELAGNTLEKGLSDFANVTRINVYKTAFTNNHSKEIIERIRESNYDIIIFTSPSGVQNFIKIMKENNCRNDFRLACIGTTTEKEIIKSNYNPLFVSPKSDGLSFACEIENYLIN